VHTLNTNYVVPIQVTNNNINNQYLIPNNPVRIDVADIDLGNLRILHHHNARKKSFNGTLSINVKLEMILYT